MRATLPIVLALLRAVAAPAAGDRIASVTLAGDDPEAAMRYERYIGLRVGDSLRQEDVRRTVRHLFATGAFDDVSVDASQTPEGQAITITLRATPRLVRVRVEGDAVLSSGAIRRITRLRDGEALWTQRLERAARDVALALADEGYLEGRATASLARSHVGAEAVFQIEAGPQTLVSAARLEGVDGEWRRLLAPLVDPPPLRPFSRKKATASATRIERRLRERGFWDAAVSVGETYDPRESRIALLLTVHTGPRTDVAFKGSAPSGRLTKSAYRILVEGGLRSGALEEVSELLEESHRREGFRSVAVTYDIENQASARHVVFTTRPGARSVAGSVKIEGLPREVPGLLLQTQVGRGVDDRLIERDADALRRALQVAGYALARVDVDVPERAGRLPVVFRVRPGLRQVLATARIESEVPLEEPTTDDLGLVTGTPYDTTRLAQARSLLTTAYRNAGFPRANVAVEPSEQAGGEAVDVVLRVDAGPRVTIDHILISGLLRTHEETVRRELLVREGEVLRWDRVLESHRRLSALGLFRSVVVQELDPEEPDRRSLLIAVDEGPRTTLTYGLGAAGLGSSDPNPTLRASAEVTRRNLGGLDRSLSVFSRLSFRGSRFLATYREPFLFGRRANLSVTAFREDEERTNFAFDRVGASLETSRGLSPIWSLVLRYTLSTTHLSNVRIPLEDVDRQYRSASSSGPSLAVVRDTRDDPLDPRRGTFLAADAQFSHAALGGHSFLKGFVQTSGFRGLRSGLLLAVGLRLGAATTFRGQDLDLPERFFAGGHYTMRGFDTDGVLPEGGRSLCVTSAELRQSITRHLSLAAFIDAGNVFPSLSDTRLSLRTTAGIGVRYRTPVGPIRLDWARNLDPREGEPRHRVHITVGHAF